MEWVEIFFIGLIAEGLGVAIGITLFYLFKSTNQKIIGMLFGATSGLMIAMICFDVLPAALATKEELGVFVGVLAGVGIGLCLEEFTTLLQQKLLNNVSKKLNSALLLTLGIALHNLPEGFALGSLFHTHRASVFPFAIILTMHSIPEAIAIAVSLKKANIKYLKALPLCIFLGGVMGIGAVCGYTLSNVSQAFLALILGFAAGIILYIVCQDLLPESRRVWNGRLTTIATVLGLLVGMFLIMGHV
jgi:ZIP family zinc transporter